MTVPVTAISVVLPARDEEERLPAALDALMTARERLASTPSTARIRCSLVVVLDSCTDDSEAIAARYAPEIRSIVVRAGSVGAARALGVETALGQAPADGRGHWILTTDADSVVPADWMLRHLGAASTGATMTLGHVRPAFDLPAGLIEGWRLAYETEGGHVHGANLGIRADAYLRLGGFPAIAEHEDVVLARRARRAGEVVVALPDSIVITSGRLDGRTPGGFAAYLRDRCGDREVS